MRKIFKILIAILAVMIVAVGLLGAVVVLNLSAYTATGSQTLTPTGTSVGNALVVYDPGLSGAPKVVAEIVAAELQAQGFTVELAGIKSAAAANTAGYNIIIAGGPIYAGTPTASVKDFLTNLNLTQTTKVGVFGSGSGATTPEDVAQITNAIAALPNGDTLANAVVVKIGNNEDINARAADFVSQLI
ncbi:MAG: flavodoxin domain-containing protein [Candidatus Bathyarchaeota archaeon]|nr:flavodoxin domain-containing protein [Candidatus Bathyarchaeota archaeon]